MVYDGAKHTTRKGTIKYSRPHHGLTGRDAVRIVLAVSKSGKGSYANWRVIERVASREANYLFRKDEIDYSGSKGFEAAGGRFEEFLQAFDKFVAGYKLLAALVPGVGFYVETVTWLYTTVRKLFPVV